MIAIPFSGTAAQRDRAASGPTVISLIPAQSDGDDARFRYDQSGLSFEIDPDSSLYLMELGNPQSLRRPQRVFSLALEGANEIGVALSHVGGRLNPLSVLFVMLCDAKGNILERAKVPFGAFDQAARFAVPSQARQSCFVIRLSEAGVFAAATVQIKLFKREADGQTRENDHEFRLQPVVQRRQAEGPADAEKAAPLHWLDHVPDDLKPALLSQLVATQGTALTRLKGRLARQQRASEAAPDAGRGNWLRQLLINLADRLPGHAPATTEGDAEQKPIALNTDHRALARRALRLFRSAGVTAALEAIFVEAADGRTQARALEELAVSLPPSHRAAAYQLFWYAYAASPGPGWGRRIALKLFKSGDISGAGSLIKTAPNDAPTRFEGELRLAAKLQACPLYIPPRGPSEWQGGHVAYVAASALPYTNAGYTVRTHSLLSALASANVQARCYLRPGYPWDRPDAALEGETVPLDHHVGSVRYTFTPVAGITALEPDLITQMSDALQQRFMAEKPGIVHAASNHRNALPALIAARRCGLPFVYEIRGLWELTAASRNDAWEETERFALERRLELTIAAHADHVLVITEALKSILVEADLPAEKISLLPNAVDPALFTNIARDEALAAEHALDAFDLAIVYAGTLTNYEGLDDLIQAIGLLRGRGVKVKFLLVGEGPFRSRLQDLVRAQALESHVTFVGRVSPDQVPRFNALADLMIFPRKNYKVCNVVSPLKPFEAMAMGKPVILSNLVVSREIVKDGVTGLLCEPENPSALADAIEQLARDPKRRAELGSRAQEWVIRERTWEANAARLRSIHERLATRPSPGEPVGRAIASRAAASTEARSHPPRSY
jgi:glycosyltransferase involved in cell wall biosynthesis